MPGKILALLGFSLVFLFPSELPGQMFGANRFEDLNFNRPESWGMKYFASTTLLSGYGPPQWRETGWLDLGLEVAQIPFLSAETRRLGFNGIKVENLNNAPVLLRPRLTYYLTKKLSLTLSYIPPLELWDVEANLFSGSLNLALLRRNSFRVGLRFYGQKGTASGPFTCTEANVAGGDDFLLNPFGCTKESSDDTQLDYLGGEISVAYEFKKLGGLRPYFSTGLNYLNLKTELDSTLFGEPDMTIEETSGTTVTFSGGFVYPIKPKLSFGFQVFYAPLEVLRPGKQETENDSLFNVRAQFTYHWGKLRKNREEAQKSARIERR